MEIFCNSPARYRYDTGRASSGADGQPEIAVETPAETWRYALEIARSYLPA